jgi:multiple sugar transport system ATP-binding protein
VAEIRLERLEKRFERSDRPALRPLDLVIPSGDLVVLVGPSGCGKSTTLRLIAGLESPSAGEVFIAGHRVTHTPPAQRDVAMVFQSYALYPHMTVRQNLAFALELRKQPRAVIEKKVAEAAQILGLGEFLDRRPAQLSGGQRQRVAIGRAVVREPKVFLFDEPLSNLDAQLRAEMRREIAKIHARTKATAVYVTHDQTEAMTLADRIVILKAGEVQQVGTPLELYDTPANRFVAGFLGTPGMSFLAGAVADGAVVVGGARVTPASPPRAGEVVVGVRPEFVIVGGTDGLILDARVGGRELTGSEAVLYLETEAGALTARTAAHGAPGLDENVTVSIAARHLHLFDPTTERRL